MSDVKYSNIQAAQSNKLHSKQTVIVDTFIADCKGSITKYQH